MKKYFLLFSLSIACFACSNQPNEEKAPDNASNKLAVMDSPDYVNGLNLIGKSDCLTCHKLREQSVGPSYGAVAEKYPNTPENVEMLAGKIITGGKDVWGAVPMTAHPALSKADAVAMVKYIMLLKDTK